MASEKSKFSDKYLNIITSLCFTAAKHEPGVASISNSPGALSDVASLSKKDKKSIAVDIIGNNVVVDISINAKFGYKLPDLIFRLQEKLKSEVEKATYFKVKSVNVNIVGVVFSQ